jgi:hypothetical protein
MDACDKLTKIMGQELDCCASCHEDSNEYDMDLIPIDYKEQIYFVCCRVANDFDRWIKTNE